VVVGRVDANAVLEEEFDHGFVIAFCGPVEGGGDVPTGATNKLALVLRAVGIRALGEETIDKREMTVLHGPVEWGKVICLGRLRA